MADTNARMRQLDGTTAEWAANNIVLGKGEIGVERASTSNVLMKVGDGVSTWSALPYTNASSTTINSATQAALDAKVSKAGDTMTGLLILSGDASNALGAVTKQQLDSVNTTLTSSITGKLSLSGGSMTGFLSLHSVPTANEHAATKAYVDGIGSARVTKAGDTMTGFLTLHADPTSAMHAVTKQYVDGGAYQTVVGGSSAYAGKVVKLNSSGLIDTSLVPVSATYLGTVNVTVAYALTGTYTPGDYFAVSATGTVDSSWTSKINGAPSSAGAGQFLIYNANGKFDLVGDTSSSAAISGKLDKTGGTMSGFIFLHADPTSALHAATKQYADTKLPLAGGTLTGALTLPADPTASLHASTKQYVDGINTAIRADFATADAGKLSLTGGTMTGAIVLAADPAAALQPATKQYVDGKLAGKITVGTTAPTSPAANDLWVDTN